MKTQLQLATAAVLIIAGSTSLKAQTNAAAESNPGIVYSIGAESGITSGGTRNIYKWSLGGSVQADIPVGRFRHVVMHLRRGAEHGRGRNGGA